jgi:IMP dehydrogenase/GMP reductase
LSDFDQVYVVPKGISTIRSRGDVDLTSDFLNLYPLFSSPMKGVSGSALVIAMGKNNCFGILHRFDSWVKRIDNIDAVHASGVPYGIAIGVNDYPNESYIAKYAVEHGASLICLDLANAYLPQIAEIGQRLRNKFGKSVALMTGNIITKEGAEYVKNSGFDFVRCSIGSGGVCTTRDATGIGRNALAVLNECSSVDITLVMDGGIKVPGDSVKSFSCGADFVMLGSVLAQSFEAEDPNGKLYGMASLENHLLNNKEIKSIEGKDKQIDMSQKKPLKEILDQFLWGIRSACTYLNAKSYKEIPDKCYIVPVNEKF